MAASPSQQQYNSSTLSTDMIDAAFQHIGGLSTTSGIAPREWEEHCQYYPPPINITQEDATPCSPHEKAAILTAPAVHFQHGEELIKNHISTEKERKVRMVVKRKKHEKCLGVPIEKKDDEEGPFGHIHVRARRGQATDSHSLAERVRRERINERMKKLQGLVPGGDKVSGRALLLDEIINYVQSLQNQVEFLSMKLASTHSMQNHIFHDQKFEDMSSPAVQSFSQPTAFAAPEINSHILDSSFQGLFLKGEDDNPLSPSQM